MTETLFVDTAVLVYAYDRAEPVKQRRGVEVLGRLAELGAGAISTQVLAELFVSLTRSLKAPLTPDEAYGRLRHYLRAWRVLPVTGLISLEAARGVCEHKMSFWDRPDLGNREAQPDRSRALGGLQRRERRRGRPVCEPVQA